MKAKINEIKSKLNLLTSRALPLVGFFGPKKTVCDRALPHGPGLPNKPRKLCGIPFEIQIWRTPHGKKIKDKVTAKRGKKSDVGDAKHQLLKGNGRRVQRLSSEVFWRAQKYAPFTEDEREHQPFCERHFATQVATSLVCNILAADQGPS